MPTTPVQNANTDTAAEVYIRHCSVHILPFLAMGRRNKNPQRDVTSAESHRKEVDCRALYILTDTLQTCLTDTSDDQLGSSTLPKSTSHARFLEIYVNAEKLNAARHRRNSHPDLSKLSKDHISIEEHYTIIDKFQEYFTELLSFQQRKNNSIINGIREALLQVEEVGRKMEADQRDKHMMHSKVKDQSKQLQKAEAEKNAEVKRRLEEERDRKKRT
ncbi:uncharacterized protein BKA55DRAFT_546857 [Fusarium redolens]|uniref:Uncharacterized protein n=1 Tax=Fusarium redolens TaxID=48865 RepID=A0A9P9FVG2_FUSRE|nr:uncharacterized protein BKA55DRAFT_546857 [Fusarium redolens]KAH7208425.1 hypothetical protein BKA55DRAFT_546857 [Fusarium redolens]